jgi:hypothetical protein
MIDGMMGILVIATGVVSAGVGIAIALQRLRVARRAYRRTATLYAAMPEGWSSWFVGGFSSLTVGSHGLVALAAFLGWSMAGLGLIGLGLRLLRS